MTTNNDLGAPSFVPSQLVTTGNGHGAGTSTPTLDEQASQAIAAATDTSPTLSPPAVAAAAGDEAAGATWRNNVRIDALWSIDETRNVFVHVVGLGWRKIYNGRDGAFQALTTLASQARQTNKAVNLREEADGMIYEIYLW
jgi:hypothetical protein